MNGLTKFATQSKLSRFNRFKKINEWLIEYILIKIMKSKKSYELRII